MVGVEEMSTNILPSPLPSPLKKEGVSAEVIPLPGGERDG